MANEVSSQNNTKVNLSRCACCIPEPIPGFPFFVPPHATMLDAALIYAAHGWPIFPCQPIDKTPYPGTHGFKDATTDPVRIRRWWSRVPDSMIGVALGVRSGIFAVDLDRKPGQPDGVATWAKLTAELGEAPRTLSSTTPSTGQHHFFRHCYNLRNVELNGVAPGIEIKAEGGYVILPPSFCTDPKFNNGAGAGYRWNTPLIVPAEPPDWLVTEIICHNNPTPTVEEEPPWSDVPIERIEAALDAIDPDLERKEWFAVGCALYKQLGDYGLELWNEWSSKGRKYNAREMKGQRQSIAKGNGYAYTIGTLFYLANEADWNWGGEVMSGRRINEAKGPNGGVSPVPTDISGIGESNAATTASVPFMLTAEVKRRLRICGYSDEQISHLTPQQAHEILTRQGWQPEAEAKEEAKGKEDQPAEAKEEAKGKEGQPAEPNQPGHHEDGGHHARQDVEWPEMEAAAYHGFAGEVVEIITPHSEADPVALLLQLLVCFGNIIGRARYIQTESNRQHPNLFLGLVGASAKTRKGTSFGRILAVGDAANHQWADERIQGGLSSGEGLIHVVRDRILKWDKEGQDWIEVDHGVDDKRLLIVEPEFASVLAIMERSGNTVSHLLRKGWDGIKLQTMTRKEPLTATDPHISIIGHITEEELRARLTRTDMANGFANRFLFALIKRSKLLPFGGNLNDEEIKKMGSKLRDIIEAVLGDPLSGATLPARLTMTEQAGEKWGHLYHDLAVEHPGLLGAITARAETQMLRLALIYALLDKENQIDLPHIEAGRAVWHYCEASAVHIFGDTLGDEVADAILRALKQAGQNGISRTMIRDLFGGHHSKARVDAALGLLAQKGRARTAPQTTGRHRPIEMWYLVEKTYRA